MPLHNHTQRPYASSLASFIIIKMSTVNSKFMNWDALALQVRARIRSTRVQRLSPNHYQKHAWDSCMRELLADNEIMSLIASRLPSTAVEYEEMLKSNKIHIPPAYFGQFVTVPVVTTVTQSEDGKSSTKTSRLDITDSNLRLLRVGVETSAMFPILYDMLDPSLQASVEMCDRRRCANRNDFKFSGQPVYTLARAVVDKRVYAQHFTNQTRLRNFRAQFKCPSTFTISQYSLHADRFRHEWDEAMTTQMTEGEFALMVRDGFTPYWRKFLTNSLFDPADEDEKFPANEMLSKCLKKETNLVTERNVKTRAGPTAGPMPCDPWGMATSWRTVLATVSRAQDDEATDHAMTTATSGDQSMLDQSGPWNHRDVMTIKDADGLLDRECPLAKWFDNPCDAECYKRIPRRTPCKSRDSQLPVHALPASDLVDLGARPAARKARSASA